MGSRAVQGDRPTVVKSYSGQDTSMLIHSILLALGLTASLCLFLSLKREIRIGARKQRQKIEMMEQRLLDASVGAPAHGPTVMPLTPRSGFNLNKRVHAMRMVRHGEDVAHIAAALGVPRMEVELLIRVQGIVTAAASAARSQKNIAAAESCATTPNTTSAITEWSYSTPITTLPRNHI